MLAFSASVIGYGTVAAYSTFATAPQIATANILASIIGAVIKLPVAKVLNIWGRAEGLLTFLAIYLIGLITITSCNGPNSYAAGYVLYQIGYGSLYLILDVFMADTSGLRNRAFVFAFASTPFICTAFTGPLAADSILAMTTWRWSSGIFCIVMPVIMVPLAVVFKFYQRKAASMGLFIHEPSGRTIPQSIVHYIHEFDGRSGLFVSQFTMLTSRSVIGALLVMAAFILFLLPFSLVSYGRATYDSATFIAMVIFGVLTFFIFYAWERYIARKHFIRWELLKERTVLGACLLAAVIFFSFYSWDLYYYNFVKVVYALPVSLAGYMGQIYNIGSTFWGVVFGVYIRYTKRFKYACLFFALPLMFLGSGLMVYFRGSDHGIGYLVMCQIFIAVAGGTLVIGEDMAVMAAADRDGVPMMLSIIGLSSGLGGAIGQAVTQAVYGHIFPKALAHALPAADQGAVQTLFNGGYLVQELYVPGTVFRTAIDYAWGRYQYYSCISAVCSLVLAIPCIAVWKNYYVGKKQNKGVML